MGYQMQEANVDRIIPLVAEGLPTQTCGEPTCISTHGTTAVWVPHRCSRSQCPVCADDGYTNQAASKTLGTIQRRILGRCRNPDHGRHRGRTLKLYKVIYSPSEDQAYDTQEDQDRDKKKMYKTLRAWGAEYGYMVGHPYRGDHGRKATPWDIRATMDRTHQSWHYHGLVVAHWMERPAESGLGSGVIVKVQCIGSFGPPARLDVIWAKAHKALTYAISHAAYSRQIICRFGAQKQVLGEPRPKAVPMWKVPGTDEVLPLRAPEMDPDALDIKRELTRELWGRYERKDDMMAGYTAEDGKTYTVLPYTVVRADPDDTAGREWDRFLLALLSIGGRESSDEHAATTPGLDMVAGGGKT